MILSISCSTQNLFLETFSFFDGSANCGFLFFADCVLSAVGKPVFNRFSSHPAGCWMRDPVGSGTFGDKYWVTGVEDTFHLYEYFNKTAFTRDRSTRNYTLSIPFRVSECVFVSCFFPAHSINPTCHHLSCWFPLFPNFFISLF